MHIVNDRRDKGSTTTPERVEPRAAPPAPKRPTRRGTWMRWAAVLGGLLAVVAVAAVIGLVFGDGDGAVSAVPVFEGAEVRTPAGFAPTGADAPEASFVAVPDPLVPRVAIGFAPTGWEIPEQAPILTQPITPQPRVPEGFVPAG